MEELYKLIQNIEKPEAAQQTGIQLKDFNFIYGMSKMVIPEDTKDGLKYLRT